MPHPRPCASATARDESTTTRAASRIALRSARTVEYTADRSCWRTAAHEVVTALLSGLAGTGLQHITRRVRELPPADCAVLLLSCADRRHGTRVHACSGDARGREGTLVPVNDPVLGGALYTGVATSAECGQEGRGIAAVLSGYGPVMAAPLSCGDGAVGALVLLRQRGGQAFTPERVTLLDEFAAQVSTGLELVAEQRDRQHRALRDDRDRIARDLHDHVIQRLFATGMDLQGLRDVCDATVRDRLYQAVREIDATVREIRSTIHDLQAPAVEPRRPSLRRRLVDVVTGTGRGCGITPRIRLTGPLDTAVPADLAEHVEAVVREAVVNALRHAGAHRIVVAVEAAAFLTVEVDDDGVGLPPDAARSGLRNLHQRATECGGSLHLESSANSGTKLVWQAPLQCNRSSGSVPVYNHPPG